MSDSQTNVDVEDVLSSIRRLVSDTAAHERDGKESESPEKSTSPDALLLTSAQRVGSPTEQEETPEQDATESSLNNLRDAVGETAETDTQADKGVDWAAIGTDEYYEDDETDTDSPVVDFIRHTPPEEGANEEPEVESEIEVEDADVDEAPEPPAEPWSPQLVSSNDFSDDALDPPAWIESGHSDIDDAEDKDANPSEVADDSMDVPEEEPLAQETMFASAAAASVLQDEDDAPRAKTEALADFDEGVIDEDALRDLVAQIVREELTGELGERITRNVRKLVRREIHRALVTREFE